LWNSAVLARALFCFIHTAVTEMQGQQQNSTEPNKLDCRARN